MAFLFDLCMALLLTALLTAPAIRYFDTRIYGYPDDGFEYVWKIRWTRRALLDLHISPARLSYVNYPFVEGNNPQLIATPLLGLLALPLGRWLSPLETYNALLFVSLALSWPTAALLCHEFTQDRASASVGGALFAFSANRMAHAVGGHLPQTFTWLFPLMALSLYRTWRTPCRRNGVWAGIAMGLSLLVDLKHMALFVAPFAILFLAFWGVDQRTLWTRKRLTSIGLAFGVAALIAVPFFLPVAIGRFSGEMAHFYAPGVVRHSADLMGFVIPPPEHPFYQLWPGLRAVSARLALPGWYENIFYLGWVAFPMAVVGAATRWRQSSTRFWVVVALVSLVLALGPVLKVDGEVVQWRLGQRSGPVPLPYALLHALPFYDWGRTPGRMVTLTSMACAVLISIGAAILLTRIRHDMGRMLIALGLVFLVVGDQIYTWPWPLADAEMPTFYKQVASMPEDFAILDLPLWEYRCERYQLYYAATHGHRIVGGLITRRSPDAEVQMRRVEALALPGTGTDGPSSLADEGIRYVILHKQCLDEMFLDQESSFLAQHTGPAVYDDRWIRVFEVPGEPVVPAHLLSAD
ncbi:MAG: hypothetical protein JXA09_13400 [Anaerolineae bacterium]|nr:hypothetical protein [Anaerolineae bacterium]